MKTQPYYLPTLAPGTQHPPRKQDCSPEDFSTLALWDGAQSAVLKACQPDSLSTGLKSWEVTCKWLMKDLRRIYLSPRSKPAHLLTSPHVTPFQENPPGKMRWLQAGKPKSSSLAMAPTWDILNMAIWNQPYTRFLHPVKFACTLDTICLLLQDPKHFSMPQGPEICCYQKSPWMQRAGKQSEVWHAGVWAEVTIS